MASSCSRSSWSKSRDKGPIKLHLSTWGEVLEVAAFERIVNRWRAIRPDVAIVLDVVSYHGRTDIDPLIAAGLGPDLIRVEYADLGRYTPSKTFIDLAPYLPDGTKEQFTAQVWSAVSQGGRVSALPHHTDTSAILYNQDAFARYGLSAPTRLEDSWTWEQFLDIGRFLMRHGFEHAFAVNWVQGGGFRWLNFLYQHGGQLLTSSFDAAAIPSAESLETLRWTNNFFQSKLVPPSDSAQSSEQIERLFASAVVPMYFDIGPQALEPLHQPFRYGTTFLPRDRTMAAELGGNALAVSRNSKHPKEAAEFLLFATNEENMREFVTAGGFLPVRRSLAGQNLVYPRHSDEMAVHRLQATTVPAMLAKTIAHPAFYRVQQALTEALDLTFTGGQDPELSLQRLSKAINRELRRDT